VKGFVILKRMKPAIVNIHFLGANAFYIMILHKVVPFRLVVTLHGGDAPSQELEQKEGYWEAKVLNWTAHRILHSADAIVCISNYLYEKIMAIYPELAPKTTIIPIGVDGSMSNRLRLRKDNMILAAGRLAHEKGFDILIRAFKEISEVYPNVDLIIAGDGEENKKLEEAVSALDLCGRVRFLGFLNKTEVMELLSECTVVVVPSRDEGFGAVILEAMTAGAPIVATSVGAIPEIIKDRETGFLVPAENQAEMAQTLDYLLGNKEIATRVGLNARTSLAGKYDWDLIAKGYKELYLRTLGDPRSEAVRN
jgi:glycosyltransferase involved in cell wall biosynthesis